MMLSRAESSAARAPPSRAPRSSYCSYSSSMVGAGNKEFEAVVMADYELAEDASATVQRSAGARWAPFSP